ncbi:MAG: DUF3298 and DUF4163 domain-containing protein [Flavobacteriaceae bacterium]|nr:DUF3298 and DUF4163 domain-containing protein [Flavobacteriaceae bacterium]
MNKIFPLLLALILASSCSFEKPLQFEEVTITQNTMEVCDTENCPTIKVNYVQAIENDTKSGVINKQILESVTSKIAPNEEGTSDFSKIEDALVFFIEDYNKVIAEFGNNFVTYDVDTFMQVSFQSEEFVSLELNYYLFTGGAHGYSGTQFLNFDANTGELLQHDSLFNDIQGLIRFCENEFRERYQVPQDRSINSSGFWFENDQFHLPENIGFTETELILHYNQYEIASYAEGPIILTIPLTEVEEFL